MRVLAFDIATSTGIAYGRAGDVPRVLTVDLGKGLPDEKRFAKAIEMTHDLLDRYKPDQVVYEAPIGGKNSSQFLIGVAACVMGEATRLRFPCKQMYLASVRKHFLGKHLTARDFPALKPAHAKRAIKQEVIKRCVVLKWPVSTDDEADAAALWDFACSTMRGHQSAPVGGLFDER